MRVCVDWVSASVKLLTMTVFVVICFWEQQGVFMRSLKINHQTANFQLSSPVV